MYNLKKYKQVFSIRHGGVFSVSSGARTVLEIVLFVLGLALCTVAAYFICTYFNGDTLAKASGLSLSVWTDKFIVLVKLSCALTAGCLFLWYFLTKMIFRVQSSADWGRRTIWLFLFLVVMVGIFVIINIYADTLRIKTDLFINVVFFLCFVVGGYWLTSIAITPSKFKFAPLGAVLFRR